MDRFAVYDEDGSPVGLADLPSERLLAGEPDPGPLLVRNVDPRDRRGALAAAQLLGAARLRRRDPARRQRDRERHRGQARRALRSGCSRESSEALAGLDGPRRAARRARARARPRARRRGRASSSPTSAAIPAARDRGRRGGVARRRRDVLRDPAVGRRRDARHADARARGAVAAARRRARGGDRAPRPASRSTTRAATPAGPRSPARSSTGCCRPSCPRCPGWSAAVLYRPAGEFNEVGGDFYDVFEGPKGWMVVIGDVAGQGAEAAARTSLARFTVRTAAELTGDVSRAVSRLNDTLRGQPGLPLCTVVCAELQRARRRRRRVVTMASAGHPPPLLVRGRAVAPVGDAGTIAGAFDDERWPAAPSRAASPATCSCSTPTACSTRWARTTASASGACARRWRGSRAAPRQRLAALRAELEAFERGPQRDDTTVLCSSTAVGAQPADAEPARRLVDDLVALAEREAHERAAGLLVVVEDAASGSRRRRRARRSSRQNATPSRAAVDVGEVGAGGPEHLEPGGLEARAQVVALGAQVARERARRPRRRARARPRPRAGTASRPRTSGTAWPCARRRRARAGRPPSPSSSPSPRTSCPARRSSACARPSPAASRAGCARRRRRGARRPRR